MTEPHPGDPPYYRESELEDIGGDDGSSPVFSVDWDLFNIKLISNGSDQDPVPMIQPDRSLLASDKRIRAHARKPFV